MNFYLVSAFETIVIIAEKYICGKLLGQQCAYLIIQALQDALKLECSSSPEDPLGKSEMECSHEEMRTEMEVLKQQVRS